MRIFKDRLPLYVVCVMYVITFFVASYCESAYPQAITQAIPSEASKHKQELTRHAHAQWGLDAPIAVFAAQIHQESGWKPQATSRVGAQGLAQFMPATSRWLCELKKIPLHDCQPNNPTWAMRALVQYDDYLYQRISAQDRCEHMAFTLSAYNGGLGWVNRDKAKASSLGLDSLTWFGHVERVNAGRSASNFHENRQYPRRILNNIAPRYVSAGWGASTCGAVLPEFRIQNQKG